MENAILTIEPGVEIKFQNSFQDIINLEFQFSKYTSFRGRKCSIYFTSNNDDFLSNTDDEEICNIEEYDEEGNLILKMNVNTMILMILLRKIGMAFI